MAEHIHAACGTEIILIYEIFKVVSEGCLPYGNKELLYIEGVTIAGSVCCGAIECRIIHVPGFLISRHYRIDESSGNPISEVEPIRDPSAREEVQRLLYRAFPSCLLLLS
jgi:hypothetical protein